MILIIYQDTDDNNNADHYNFFQKAASKKQMQLNMKWNLHQFFSKIN